MQGFGDFSANWPTCCKTGLSRRKANRYRYVPEVMHITGRWMIGKRNGGKIHITACNPNCCRWISGQRSQLLFKQTKFSKAES